MATAATRFRTLPGVFQRSLTSGAVERDDFFRRLAGETARVPVTNLPGHLDRSNVRSLHYVVTSLGDTMLRAFVPQF